MRRDVYFGSRYADKGLTCVIYTGDNDARPDDILDRAKNRFDIVVDERKLHFVYLRWVAGSKVGCYVHYPVVSADMIKSVESREARFNNAEWISSSWLFSLCKLIYYRIFAFFYGLCGKCADVVMVNGSWTRNHILELWRMPERTFVVYPPCNVHAFLR
uniref:ALG11_N domain-containing protein n=1 Tax=Ascaris lumbricoides TaxID=6252 RepID=A0A0M3IAB4_ASCLU